MENNRYIPDTKEIISFWELIISLEKENVATAFQIQKNWDISMDYYIMVISDHIFNSFKDSVSNMAELSGMFRKWEVELDKINGTSLQDVKDVFYNGAGYNNHIKQKMEEYGFTKYILDADAYNYFNIKLANSYANITMFFKISNKVFFTGLISHINISEMFCVSERTKNYNEMVSYLLSSSNFESFCSEYEYSNDNAKFKDWLSMLLIKFGGITRFYDILQKIRRYRWNKLVSLGTFSLGDPNSKNYLSVERVKNGKAKCWYIQPVKKDYSSKLSKFKNKDLESLFDKFKHLL